MLNMSSYFTLNPLPQGSLKPSNLACLQPLTPTMRSMASTSLHLPHGAGPLYM